MTATRTIRIDSDSSYAELSCEDLVIHQFRTGRGLPNRKVSLELTTGTVANLAHCLNKWLERQQSSLDGAKRAMRNE